MADPMVLAYGALYICEWRLEVFERALGVEWPYIKLALRVWRAALGLWPRGRMGADHQLPGHRFFYGEVWRLKGAF